MKDRIEQLERVLALLFKYEVHAFMLLLSGAGLALAGHKDEGMLVIGAAVAIFKGRN